MMEDNNGAYQGMFSRGTSPAAWATPPCLFAAHLPGRGLDAADALGGAKADIEQNVLSWLGAGAAAKVAPRPLAEEWHGKALPSELVLHVEATAEALLTGIKEFLAERLPVQVLEDASETWRLQAIAFVDYTPHHLEVQVYQRGGTATARLRSAGRLEALQLHNVRRILAGFLADRGLRVEGLPPTVDSSGLPGAFDDDDFADEFGDDEEFWREHFGFLLEEALSSKKAAVREESAQALARQADGSKWLVALAKAMAAQRGPLLQAFGEGAVASLAEAFPLAAALRAAAALPVAAEVLAAARLGEACAGKGAAALVRQTLAAAVCDIRKAAALSGAGGG